MGQPIATGDLVAEFERAFPAKLAGPRHVGQESEYPVVTASGAAADVSMLWPLLAAAGDLQPKFDAVNQAMTVGLEGAEYGYALEVGRGTIEINTRPCLHLVELETVHKAALHRLVWAASQLDLRVLGYGVHPLTPPSLSLLSPKQRYHALLQSMGDDWLWYTVTASEQLHVDVARPELVRMLNLGLMMAPVVVALCGNSPIYGGVESPYCSAREGVAEAGPYANRHGMPAAPYADLADFVAGLARLPSLLRREHKALLPDGRLFAEVMDEGAGFADFLLHDHYIWHSARLRVAHATLELRPACQQPPGNGMVAAALYLGLMEAAPQIEAFLARALGNGGWDALRAYWPQAIRQGLAAPQPTDNFLSQLLALAQAALLARGYGEERYLAPLWTRLATGRNPAQQARDLFHSRGMDALIDFSTLRPTP